MATLSLNLTLTDEQYQHLMMSSFDTIMNDPATIAALRELVINNLADYMKNSKDMVRAVFYDHNPTYGWEQGLTAQSKDILHQATKHAADKISSAVGDYMVEAMQNQNIEAFVQHIMTVAVMQGAVSGLDNWRGYIEEKTWLNTAGIQDIKSRLNLDQS